MNVLEEIKSLYDLYKQASLQVESQKEQLNIATKEQLRLQADIGQLMAAHNLIGLTMSDGKQLDLKTTYYGSTARERLDDIRRFLAERGSQAILKPKKLNLSADKVELLPSRLQSLVDYEINTSTLKAFLADLAKTEGITAEIQDLFKVHIDYRLVVK